MLSWLEKRLRRYAVPRLTLLLILGQALLFVLTRGAPERLSSFVLDTARVRQGEWWRLLTFLFYPPLTNVVFAFFALYIFYLMGSALEARWGDFRYNVYILIGWLASVAAAFLVPRQAATNAYIGGSVFLAFAYLYPDFVLHIFFVLPVKIRYLAWLTWLLYGYQLAFGAGLDRVLILAAVSNFALFFGKDIALRARTGARHMERAAPDAAESGRPFHRCAVCGKTEKTDPKMDFRVCPECRGAPDYCADHIFDHEHVPKPDAGR